jgi:hypothetical protein
MINNNEYRVLGLSFDDGYNPDTYARLKEQAKIQTDFFLSSVDLNDEDQDQDQDLDAWVAPPTAQNLLVALIADIYQNILSFSKFALPAHDIRQICFKDVAEGLRFYQMEKPQGFKSTFLIPMIGHDFGRLVEGYFFHPDNPHDNWIPHSQLSYLSLKAILDKPTYSAMPQTLKNHFLYAVAAHSGENGKTYMSRAVQTCDRMQLIGPEGFLRALSYVVCLMEEGIKYPVSESYKNDLPQMNDHTSALSLLEYYSRNMLDNIGDEHKKWQRQVAIENVALLLMACHDNQELYQEIFAPECNPTGNFGPYKQRISDDVMSEAKNLYLLHSDTYQMLLSQYVITQKFFDLLQCPVGSALLTDTMKMNMTRAMAILMANERHSLYKTLCLAETLRIQQDDCDRQVIMNIGSDAPAFIQSIAEIAKAYCPETNACKPTEQSLSPPKPA